MAFQCDRCAGTGFDPDFPDDVCSDCLGQGWMGTPAPPVPPAVAAARELQAAGHHVHLVDADEIRCLRGCQVSVLAMPA